MGARALRPGQGQAFGIVPGLALAGALHLVLFVLIEGVGIRSAAPGPPLMPVTLVSLPPPEPPLPSPPIESAQPAAEPVAPDRPEPPLPAPEPAAEPAADTSQKPEDTLSPTLPKAVLASVPRPAPSRPVRPVARRQAVPASNAAAASPFSDAPAQPTAPPHAAPSAAAEASFEARLLQAVQAEARRSYPAAARIMRSTGQAVVTFEYRDGRVHVTGLAQTSGSPLLDRAAVAAVQNATYPASPGELAGRTLIKTVHVKFELETD